MGCRRLASNTFLSAFVLCLASSIFAAESHSDPDATLLDFANGLYARKMYAPAVAEYAKFISENPSSPAIASARFRYADSLYFTKDYRAAVGCFKSFIKEFPADARVPMARFRVGMAHYYLNDQARAMRVFLGLARETKDPVVKSGCLFYAAKCYDARGVREKSLGLFKELLDDFPDSEYAAYAGVAVGDHYLEAGRQDEAVASYEAAASKKEPAALAGEARLKIAEIYFNRKDFEKAKGYYQKVFDETPEEKALLGLFYCDFYGQDVTGALRRFQEQKSRVSESAYAPQIHMLVASLLISNKNWNQALDHLEALVADPRADPELADKALVKEASVLSQLGRKEDALLVLQKVLDGRSAESPSAARHPDSDAAKAALYDLALLHLERKNAALARESFASFVGKYPSDPNAPRARLEIVQIDLDAGHYLIASQNARQFTADFPESPLSDVAHYKWGVALTGLQKFDEAAGAFDRILSAYPSSVLCQEALYGKAVNLESAGRVKEAIPLYEKLAQEFPANPLAADVFSRLGDLYIQTGDPDSAANFYQYVLFEKTDVKIRSDEVFWLVQYWLDLGDYASMQKVLGAIPARLPGERHDHETHFFLGEAAMGRGDYPKAAGEYVEALRLAPNGAYAAEAYLGAGIASAAQNDMAAAEKNFNSVLRYDDELSATMRARFEIANIRLREGNLEAAAKAFMLVAILYDDPKITPLSLYKAGECFSKTNHPEDAQKAFAELKSRYPDSEWARKAAP